MKNSETREVNYYSIYALNGSIQVPIEATSEEVSDIIQAKVNEDSKALEYYGIQLEDWHYD